MTEKRTSWTEHATESDSVMLPQRWATSINESCSRPLHRAHSLSSQEDPPHPRQHPAPETEWENVLLWGLTHGLSVPHTISCTTSFRPMTFNTILGWWLSFHSAGQTSLSSTCISNCLHDTCTGWRLRELELHTRKMELLADAPSHPPSPSPTQKTLPGDFPSSPVVKTPCLHCTEHKSDP